MPDSTPAALRRGAGQGRSVDRRATSPNARIYATGNGAIFPAGASIWANDWQIGHIWSLNVEEHSDIFLAIGALLLRQAKSKMASILFLFTTVAAVVGCCIWYMAQPPAGASP